MPTSDPRFTVPFGLAVVITLTGCGPSCHDEKYCRVFDILGACTASACTIQRGTLTQHGGPQDYAGSTIRPTNFTQTDQLPVSVSIDLAAFASQRSGLDRLNVDFTEGLPVPPDLVAITAAGNESACSSLAEDGWICNAMELGDVTLNVTVNPVYPNFTMRVFYRQSKCTSTRRVCGL